MQEVPPSSGIRVAHATPYPISRIAQMEGAIMPVVEKEVPGSRLENQVTPGPIPSPAKQPSASPPPPTSSGDAVTQDWIAMMFWLACFLLLAFLALQDLIRGLFR
jgi:hypothetical protein